MARCKKPVSSSTVILSLNEFFEVYDGESSLPSSGQA
jgi:hypothetical protein